MSYNSAQFLGHLPGRRGAVPTGPGTLLAEPVRFRHAWEQQASLRIRNGRIIGGNQEEIMDAAAAAYVALSADGTDTLLMAADHALRRELNRRIREDLITLSVVSSGPAVTIADATRASPGDLIICTRNDHTTEAGEPGRVLANGDLLAILHAIWAAETNPARESSALS